MTSKNKEVSFSLTKHSAEKVATGLSAVEPGDTVTIEGIDSTLQISIKNSQTYDGNNNFLFCKLKRFIPFVRSGHSFSEIETHKNKVVTVSRCKTCDKIDISWE